MSKKISVTELRNQLGELLDQLEQGQSYFVVERKNQEVAVLLNIEKFRDIMQTLELLNTLDFIDPSFPDFTPEKVSSDTDKTNGVDFPDLILLRPEEPEAPDETGQAEPPRTRHRQGGTIEDVAAKLGIRIIK